VPFFAFSTTGSSSFSNLALLPQSQLNNVVPASWDKSAPKMGRLFESLLGVAVTPPNLKAIFAISII
jgi:hypothetical protein